MITTYPIQQGKKTWEQLEEISRFGYSHSAIFSDFLDICLASLLSLTHNLQYVDIIDRLQQNKLTGKYEEQYMQIVAKYPENKTKKRGNRPADYFANAWGFLQQETQESEGDILGELFMTHISHGEHGQFFTPQPLTDMMAMMVGVERGEEGKRKAVSDPACGSGRFFISVGKLNKDAHFHGVDLALICTKMAVLNMWLFDLNADIYHGDSLTMKMQTVWKIRKGGFVYEAEITEPESMPEPVKKQIQLQAEQQQLFDFEAGEEK